MANTPEKNTSIEENLKILIAPFIQKVLQDKPPNLVEYGADYFQNLSNLKKPKGKKMSGELEEKKNEKRSKGSVSLDTLLDEQGREVDIRETCSWGHTNEKKAQKQRRHVVCNRADLSKDIGDTQQKSRITGDKFIAISDSNFAIVTENEKLTSEKMSQGDSFGKVFMPKSTKDSDSNHCSKIDDCLSELVDRASALHISAEESTSNRKRWEKETIEPSFKVKSSVFPQVDSSAEESGSDIDDYGCDHLFDGAERVVNVEQNFSGKKSNSRKGYRHGNVSVNRNLMLIRINELTNGFSQTFNDLIFKLRAAELDFNRKLQMELMTYFQNLNRAHDEKQLFSPIALMSKNTIYKDMKQDKARDILLDYSNPIGDRPRYAIKRNLTGSQKRIGNEHKEMHCRRAYKPQLVGVNIAKVDLNSAKSFGAQKEENKNKRMKSETPDKKDVFNLFHETPTSEKRNNKMNSNTSKEFVSNIGNYNEDGINNTKDDPKEKNTIEAFGGKEDKSSFFKFGRKKPDDHGKDDNSKGESIAARPTSTAVCRPFSISPDGVVRVSSTACPLEIGEQGDVLHHHRRESSTRRDFNGQACAREISEYNSEPLNASSNNAISENHSRKKNQIEYELLTGSETDEPQRNANSDTAPNVVDAKQFFDGLINRNRASTDLQSKNINFSSDSNARNEACSNTRGKNSDLQSISIESGSNLNTTDSNCSRLCKDGKIMSNRPNRDDKDSKFANGHVRSKAKNHSITEDEDENLDINNHRNVNNEDIELLIDSGENVSESPNIQYPNGVFSNGKQSERIGSETSVSEAGDQFMKQEIISETLMKQNAEPGLTSAGGDCGVGRNGDGNAREQQNISDGNALNSSGISMALVENAVREALKEQAKAEDDMEFDYFSNNDSSEYCSSELSDDSYSKED